MIKLRHAVAFALILSVGFSFTPPAVRATETVSMSQTPSPTPQPQTVHIVGHLVINEAEKKDIYNYVTNLENDKFWYPGVIGSELIQGNGGPGTTYKTTMNFGQGEIIVTATVLKVNPFSKFKFTSDGFLANTTEYKFEKMGHNKVKFTIESRVEGTTTEMITGYMEQTFQGLLNALGKTGEVKSIKAKYVRH